jgi:hypothetical protein
MPASFLTAAGLAENNTFTGNNTFSGAVTFTGTTVDEGAQAIAPAASASGTPTVPLTVTAAVDLAMTASTEAPSVYLDLSASRQFATGAITSQRAFKIAAPTYRFVGASTITNAATLYIDAAPTAGTNATITNAYALWIDAGTARFDGAVILAGGGVLAGDIQFDSTDASGTPGAATINKPSGTVAIAIGAASVTVTNSLVTASSRVFATLQFVDATLTTIRTVVPGAGSFVITGNGNATAATKVAFFVVN